MESDSLTVFGLLNYNSKTDQFTFDNPIAFLDSANAASIGEMLDQFKREFYGFIFKGVVCAAASALVLYSSVRLGYFAYEKYREQKLNEERNSLTTQDRNSCIEGAPS